MGGGWGGRWGGSGVWAGFGLIEVMKKKEFLDFFFMYLYMGKNLEDMDGFDFRI